MTKKAWWICTLLLVTVATIYIYWEYNRKPADLADKKPDYTLTATDLVKAFESNETAANKKYLNRIIQVTGTVSSVSMQKDSTVSLTLGDALEQVGCVLDRKYAVKEAHYPVSGVVKIKGICTGYLMGVELNRCVVIE